MVFRCIVGLRACIRCRFVLLHCCLDERTAQHVLALFSLPHLRWRCLTAECVVVWFADRCERRGSSSGCQHCVEPLQGRTSTRLSSELLKIENVSYDVAAPATVSSLAKKLLLFNDENIFVDLLLSRSKFCVLSTKLVSSE